jgi:hypothetical protein
LTISLQFETGIFYTVLYLLQQKCPLYGWLAPENCAPAAGKPVFCRCKQVASSTEQTQHHDSLSAAALVFNGKRRLPAFFTKNILAGVFFEAV